MYYNRAVPLPLGLTDIAARLASDYYRQPAAVGADVALLAHNAALFNNPASDVVRNAGGEFRTVLHRKSRICSLKDYSPFRKHRRLRCHGRAPSAHRSAVHRHRLRRR